jgi:hypothetical protein
MPAGSRELSSLPAAVSIQGGHATVAIGGLTYRFGSVVGESQPTLEVVGKDHRGRPYRAHLLNSAGKIGVDER